MFHSAKCCLRPIPLISPHQLSVFDRLSAQTSEEPRTRRKRKAKKSHLAAAFINMTGRGRDRTRSQRGRQAVHAPSVNSPNPEYRPGLSQVLIELEGAFRGTCSRVAVPYNYGQPFSFTRAKSSEPLKSLFQWSDDEGEASDYASSATVSSEQKGTVSANMTDNNHDNDLHRHMEAQEQTFKAQQATLDNIQQMLAQLLNNRNNDETIGSNHDEKENTDTEPPKTEKSKGSSAIDADVIKGIQAQIASLTQRDELKKVRMTRPYPLEWDLIPYPQKFKPSTLHTYDGKSSPN